MHVSFNLFSLKFSCDRKTFYSSALKHMDCTTNELIFNGNINNGKRLQCGTPISPAVIVIFIICLCGWLPANGFLYQSWNGFKITAKYLLLDNNIVLAGIRKVEMMRAATFPFGHNTDNTAEKCLTDMGFAFYQQEKAAIFIPPAVQKIFFVCSFVSMFSHVLYDIELSLHFVWHSIDA